MARDLTEGAGLALRVLGGFEVCVGDRTVSLPANAQRVLGYLAVTGAESRREVLAAHLWSWTSQARAQANLRTALWRVRQASAQLITSKRDVVRLGVGVKVDYTEMMSCALRLIDTALAPDDALITSARLLEADLLPGWDEDWLLIDRERHRQLRMHALEALSRRLVDCGEYARAVDAAYAAIAVEPLYESAQATLIAAHLAEGNRGDPPIHRLPPPALRRDWLGTLTRPLQGARVGPRRGGSPPGGTKTTTTGDSRVIQSAAGPLAPEGRTRRGNYRQAPPLSRASSRVKPCPLALACPQQVDQGLAAGPVSSGARVVASCRGRAVLVVDDQEVFFAERLLFFGVEDRGLEELLGDQGGHEGRQDDDGD
jgi:DNA-binding SARP family transcriptional activator